MMKWLSVVLYKSPSLLVGCDFNSTVIGLRQLVFGFRYL